VKLAESWGFDCGVEEVNPALKPHQAAIAAWMVSGGRRGCFAAFGLGKTVMELETCRLMVHRLLERQGHARALIVLPLGVRQEFKRDATQILGWPEPPLFVRRLEEVLAHEAMIKATSGGPLYDADLTRIIETTGKSADDLIGYMVRTGWSRGRTDDGRWEYWPPDRSTDQPINRSTGPACGRVYLTNYETIRDGKLDPAEFDVVCLDEAAILRGFGGTKTFREMMRLCTGDGGPTGIHRTDGKRVPYRFVATATPAPNEYIELLAYAEFLGIMDISQAKTRFFKRDSTHADNLTLHPHKEREFWMWVASWGIFIQRPSDLGFSDEGYRLPEMQVHWHQVATDHSRAAADRGGQRRLFANAAIGVQHAAAEKRNSLPARIAKMMELRALDPGAHRLIWHDLEAERHAIEAALGEQVAGSQEPVPGQSEIRNPKSEIAPPRPWASVFGSQDLDEREEAIIAFSDGRIQELAAKPVIAGSGCNFQRHCSWAIFLGIGFKFNDFIQAIHRIQRFMQERPVRIDLIYTEAEGEIRKQLERKWHQHNQMVRQMTEIIREFGLSHAAMAGRLARKMGVERVEVTHERYRLVNNDCVVETGTMADASVHLVVTSIPFSTQYEYSPNYADFGHSEGNAEFFGQMDYLTPELLRVLAPGRIAAIHVKDRIVPGGMTGLGFQTVYPFHCRCIEHYTRHGFAYMGMITVVTDVVRENNQTYRLGWTRQCQDGTCMGVGMPEYILLFRRPPTDRSNSYADLPVVKDKADYSRSRWQIDAHGYWRSSGDRLLRPDELRDLPHAEIFRWHRRYSLANVYDLEHHVRICEQIEAHGRLPTTFMLLQPQSWAPEVWADITRMRTLNSSQHAAGKQQHLCPLQFDIVDRLVRRFSMPGETVYDPFGGLMTVPYRAITLGRFGVGCELNPEYFTDGATYCRAAAAELAMPSLFSIQDEEQEGTAEVAEDAEDAEKGDAAREADATDGVPAAIGPAAGGDGGGDLLSSGPAQPGSGASAAVEAAAGDAAAV
jgi:hypothetical protein